MRPWSIKHACRALVELAAGERAGLAALSRMIGRPDHFLSRFVREGHPAALRDDDRLRLARFFGVDDGVLSEAGPQRRGLAK